MPRAGGAALDLSDRDLPAPRADAGAGGEMAPGQFGTIQIILRSKMALVLIAPLFATWMAHGALF
jgi:uncharacterized membrane protein